MNMNFTFTQAKRFRRDSSGEDDIEDEDSCEEELAGFQPGGVMVKKPKPGKKTRGRVKVKMEFIKSKLRRYTTFSKRKTGIMKKAYELATLTGTQVMVLVASETGHVYTFATQKLQPIITSESGKLLIQTCLNSPEPGLAGAKVGPDNSRMTESGYEEHDLSYNVANMEDIEEEEEDDSQEARLRVCSSKEPSPEEADDPPSSPSSPHSPPSMSSSVIKSEAVSWPSLTPPQPPVMTIPPHVLSELMSSVETPVSISASSSAASRVRIPPPLPPPHRNSNAPSMRSKERLHLTSFRPIEPSVSHQFPSLSLKPIPLSEPKQPRTGSETRLVSSLQTSLPYNVRLNEMSRFVLPQHPLPNVKKK